LVNTGPSADDPDSGVLSLTCSEQILENIYKEKVIFDTGCSLDVTGIKRDDYVGFEEKNGEIRGFDGSIKSMKNLGLKRDGQWEAHVPEMKDLSLVSAARHIGNGIAVLLADGGFVTEGLTTEQRDEIISKIELMNPNKKMQLTVKDNIFVVDSNSKCSHWKEFGLLTRAKFFNVKVDVQNEEQRIITLMLCGFSTLDQLKILKHGCLAGFPPDLTKRNVQSFINKYGATPDLIKMAFPTQDANVWGLLDDVPKPSGIGEVVEIDEFECDFNLRAHDNGKRTRKLPTLGGAVKATILVDKYSGYIIGYLRKPLVKNIDVLKFLITQLEVDHVVVQTIASDGGIVSQSHTAIGDSEALSYLTSKGIKHQLTEPYNHERGSPTVEAVVKMIKTLMRIAYTYIMRNPNLSVFGFTKLQLQSLWGEIVFWAITVINCKPYGNGSKTRFELYYGYRPNMQNIRLLPIFSCVLVYRPRGVSELQHEEVSVNGPVNTLALYVGPAKSTPGAIRGAIIVMGRVFIVVTSRFTSATDGGGLNLHPIVQAGTTKLLSLDSGECIQHGHPILELNEDSQLSFDLQLDSAPVDPYHDRPIEECSYEDGDPTMPTKDCSQIGKQARKNSTEKEQTKVKSVASKDNASKGEDVACLRRYNTRSSGTKVGVSNEVFFAEWHRITSEPVILFSFNNMCYYSLDNNNTSGESLKDVFGESAFTALKGDNLPRTFSAALRDPDWQEAAKKEWQTITDSKCLVVINDEIAREDIQNGAIVVNLFPVYERKIQDGKVVNKVRLVADGRMQDTASNTYASTPSREELLILMQLSASMGWDNVHLDEKRAFLSADYNDEQTAYARVKGDKNWYQILGALYGLKTSPRDYQLKQRYVFVQNLGFHRLSFCGNIFVKHEGCDIFYLYTYVDDFWITGSSTEKLMGIVCEIREKITTTEPLVNPEKILGMNLERRKDRKLILISMKEKIEEVYTRFKERIGNYVALGRRRKVPMPTSGYVITDEEAEILKEDKRRPLNKLEITMFMELIGSFIWIGGIRYDIVLATLYLTWYTKSPLLHHLEMACYLLQYLQQSADEVLVLGGNFDHEINGYTDASHATAPKRRSVIGEIMKLNEKAGAVYVKVGTTNMVALSSFEAELEGVSRGFKSMARIDNILRELEISLKKYYLWTDNQTVIDFVKGQATIKGSRHMDLRLFYIRERYELSNTMLGYMPGTVIPANLLTKLGSEAEHVVFKRQVLGHELL